MPPEAAIAEAPAPWNWSLLRIAQPPEPLELFRSLPVGENGESYDLELSPWAAAVFDWFTDPTVDWIYLIQASQTSKTLTMLGLLLWAAKYQPGPAIWVSALEDEADKFCVQRLKPFLETADATTRTGRKKDWRKHDLRIYGRMLLHIAWAGSPSRLRSWPCQYVFGDECGIWPASLPRVGDPLEYIKKRTRRYRNRKGIFATTPGTPDHPSWIEAAGAAFARWYVPCPECGEYQYLAWSRVRFNHCHSANGWDFDRVARETYYECEHCHAELSDADRAAMIKAGRLQYVDPETGEPFKPSPGNRARALQIPATYSLFTPLGQLATMFLRAKAKGPDALRIFVTDELAEAWHQPTEAPAIEVARRAADPDRNRGSVPDEAVAITAGCDVHADLIYYVVRAWGAGPDPASWQIAYGQLPIGPAGLAVLDDVLLTDYAGRPVDWTYIDSGWRPELVYPYCQQRGPRIAPSKGVTGSRQTALIKPSQLETTKVRHAKGLTLYLINTDHFKAYIHEHLQIHAGDPGAWRLLAEAQEDETYLRQLLAESRQPVTQAGRTTYRWTIHDKAAGNHYLDCEVLAAAAAWYPVRAHRIQPPASQPETNKPADQPDRPTAPPAQRPWIQRPRTRPWLG